MRVLVVTNDLPPRIGGIQYYVDQLCRGLAAAGDDVTIYGSSYEGDAAWDSNAPFRVIRERTSVLLPTPLVRSRVHRLVERYDPQVVIFGAAFPLGFLGPGITKRFGVPYVRVHPWSRGLGGQGTRRTTPSAENRIARCCGYVRLGMV